MKPKKFRSKLSLNKKTIADLNEKAMRHLKGGCLKTDVQSGCLITYTCMADTCPTDCVVTCYYTCGASCEGVTCQGTLPDCPCIAIRTE